jgi:hypothetical protein
MPTVWHPLFRTRTCQMGLVYWFTSVLFWMVHRHQRDGGTPNLSRSMLTNSLAKALARRHPHEHQVLELGRLQNPS